MVPLENVSVLLKRMLPPKAAIITMVCVCVWVCKIYVSNFVCVCGNDAGVGGAHAFLN